MKKIKWEMIKISKKSKPKGIATPHLFHHHVSFWGGEHFQGPGKVSWCEEAVVPFIIVSESFGVFCFLHRNWEVIRIISKSC